MQLAGVHCALCQKNVLVDSDATWCARCATVLHCKCLAAAGGTCPVCRAPYDQPERHFVFSQECPECFEPNNPSQPHCTACAASTRWDNQAAFDTFLAHLKETARLYLLRGLAELTFAALCLVALIAMFTEAPRFGFVGAVVV